MKVGQCQVWTIWQVNENFPACNYHVRSKQAHDVNASAGSEWPNGQAGCSRAQP